MRAVAACTARHAHNYYQVAASLFLRAGEVEHATAALWPVSAGDDTEHALLMADAGFHALAWTHAARPSTCDQMFNVSLCSWKSERAQSQAS